MPNLLAAEEFGGATARALSGAMSIDRDPDPAAASTDSDRPWLARDRRPHGVDDATIEATGKLGEALEWVERARGRLYDFHQMSGRADLLMGEAAEALDDAGHGEWAQRVRDGVVGRNVLEGRWTFQIVEEYDATYWREVRAVVAAVEGDLTGGARHVYESEMKEQRRTHGRRHHEQRPD